MTEEQERVDNYQATVNRLEPDITHIDRDAALASIAISLRRIADVMESLDKPNEYGDSLNQKLYYAIYNPLMEALAHWLRSR